MGLKNKNPGRTHSHSQKRLTVMNIKPKMQCIIGLVLAIGLVGGSTNWLISPAVHENSGKELEAVKAILLVHNPGQISYISFPMTGPLATQLESDPKIVRFPGEGSSPRNRNFY
jgi:hypothetical protein